MEIYNGKTINLKRCKLGNTVLTVSYLCICYSGESGGRVEGFGVASAFLLVARETLNNAHWMLTLYLNHSKQF